MTKKRDLNLDFVRAVSSVFLLLAHFFDHTGLYEFDTSLPVRFISVCLRMGFGTCVAVFIMLSGWLLSEKKLSARYYLGFLHIYLTYLVCSGFTFLLRAFVQHEPTDIAYMVGSIVNFYSVPYAWYLLMYLGLFLMIPFLNLSFNGLETDRGRLVLIATFLYLSILPTLLNTHVQLLSVWWKNLAPIAYYFTGAYLRRHPPRMSSLRAGGLLLLAVLGFSALDMLTRGTDGAWTVEVSSYDHYQAYVCAVLCFIMLLNAGGDRLPAGAQKLVMRISRLTLGIYLMSGITDALVYPLLKARVPDLDRQLLWWIPASLLSYAGAAFFAQLADWIVTPLDRVIRSVLQKRIPSLTR